MASYEYLLCFHFWNSSCSFMLKLSYVASVNIKKQLCQQTSCTVNGWRRKGHNGTEKEGDLPLSWNAFLVAIYYVFAFSRHVSEREPSCVQLWMKKCQTSQRVLYFSHWKVDKTCATALKSGRVSAPERRHAASHLGFSLQVVPVETPGQHTVKWLKLLSRLLVWFF